MDEAPPPSDHVLRPHHITLLTILMMAFKDLEIKKFPAAYSLHIYRVLLNEISEVRSLEPLSWTHSTFIPTHRLRNRCSMKN